MTYQKPKTIAIIGAGTAGLTLAIFLHNQGINSRIFELQKPGSHPASALNLAPNGLRVWDSAGVYSKLFEDGASQTAFHSYDFDGHELGQFCVGSKPHFGYDSCVPYRDTLLSALEDELEGRGIRVEWGRKYSHVISDDDRGVTFAFEDGSQETADMLVGSDGIWSKLRALLNPGVSPIYSGQLAVHSEIKVDRLRFPEGIQFPAQWAGSLQSLAMIPTKRDGRTIFFRQMDYPDIGRQGWADLSTDKSELHRLFTAQQELYPDFLQTALKQLDPDLIGTWAFHELPKLEHWSSWTGRVVIVGDAAHAMPPSGGQGANQAAEDAFTLAQILGHQGEAPLKKRLCFWQSYREARMDRIIDLTRKMTTSRQTRADGEKIEPPNVADPDNMQWLYGTDLDEDLQKVYAQLD